ncbi:RNA polymerase sigma factor [Actinorugispora endophytica]|uniref:RNA polymerase sigma factor n=1 Tax=Actinorugispora endophytica TaxID=1605990 RepID=UPI001FB7CCA3|nr:sigma-70 family RNA polymerase sigma factor [Actinorugispora endophytica]
MSDQTHGPACVKELVRRAAEGDEEAWDVLLDRYAGRVWGVVRSHPLSFHDAQDITQTVLCNLAENLHRLRDPERIGAWLATVARNECRRHLRASGRTRPLPPGDLDRPDDRTPESAYLVAEQTDRVRTALTRLDRPQSEVVRLALEHPELSRAEVARLAGVAESDVSRVRRRARRRLALLLREDR